MCGIVGRINFGGAIDRDLLARQSASLVHRGPDAMGQWCSHDLRVGLAHRRLSIVDLSAAGTQPMTNAAGTTRIVYNGEIYNFRELRKQLAGLGRHFTTQTDTEVILAAYEEWGQDFVKRLRGQFAFVIYDERNRQIFCARDRTGEKPFFYRKDAIGFSFASELKALLLDGSYPRQINAEAMDAYFAFGFVPGDLCILQGFYKLRAAHTLTLDLSSGNMRIEPYWTLPDPEPNTRSDEDLTDELDHLLTDAVRMQLLADVPVGILLSGGIDSSIVAAAAAAASRDVRTFTVNFPQSPIFDEGPAARSVAAHLGTQHTDLTIEPPDFSILDFLSRQFDEPIADSSMIPTYLISRAIREHATVAVGGDGGDELFGGYPHYRWLQKQALIARIVPPSALRAVSRIGQRMTIGAYGRNHLIGSGGTLANRVAHVNLYFDAGSRARLLGPAAVAPNAERIKERLCHDDNSSRVAARVDFLTYLTDSLLVKTDRASMAASLELRAPFLDVGVIEFAFRSVPERLKVSAKGTKIILRKLARRKLPVSIANKPKQGFSVPLGDWLQGPWGGFMREVLEEAPPTLFDPRFIATLQAAHAKGYRNAQRLYALTVFELWRRAYGVDDFVGPEPDFRNGLS